MGTWGSGNFEGDSSRDFLASMVVYWESIIDRALAGEPTQETDWFHFEPGLETIDGALMPILEIILVVFEQLDCDQSLEVAKVEDWSRKFLEIYDAEIDDLDPDDEYKVGRRQVIEATFGRLLKIAREHEEREG